MGADDDSAIPPRRVQGAEHPARCRDFRPLIRRRPEQHDGCQKAGKDSGAGDAVRDRVPLAVDRRQGDGRNSQNGAQNLRVPLNAGQHQNQKCDQQRRHRPGQFLGGEGDTDNGENPQTAHEKAQHPVHRPRSKEFSGWTMIPVALRQASIVVVRRNSRRAVRSNRRPRCSVQRLSHMTRSPACQRWR